MTTVYCEAVQNIYFELTITLAGLLLRAAHERICDIAERLMPVDPAGGATDANAERR